MAQDETASLIEGIELKRRGIDARGIDARGIDDRTYVVLRRSWP